MRKILLPIVLVLFASQVFGEAREELEVGFTFREMFLFVEDQLSEDAAKIGLTGKDIEMAVKLKLLARGIRTVDDPINGSLLYIGANVLGDTFNFDLVFKKDVVFYYPVSADTSPHWKYLKISGKWRSIWIDVWDAGTRNTKSKVMPPRPSTRPSSLVPRAPYSFLSREVSRTRLQRGDKRFILEAIEAELDRFLSDYLESNLQYEQTLKDGVLRGVDRVIQKRQLEVRSGVSPASPKAIPKSPVVVFTPLFLRRPDSIQWTSRKDRLPPPTRSRVKIPRK